MKENLAIQCRCTLVLLVSMSLAVVFAAGDVGPLCWAEECDTASVCDAYPYYDHTGEGPGGEPIDMDDSISEPYTPSMQDDFGSLGSTPRATASAGLAGYYGAPSGISGAGVPNMIGDSIGAGCGVASFNGQALGAINHPIFPCSRQKIAENNSPLPRDRVYFTYQHFDNAIFNRADEDDFGVFRIAQSNTDVDKFLFGIERTFYDEMMSVQLQIPFASQVTNRMEYDFGLNPSVPSDRDVQFGNISLALKGLLYQNCTTMISAGLLVELPTAPDVRIRAVDTTIDVVGAANAIDLRLQFDNRQVNLAPFLGLLYQPNSRAFYQGFLQVDTAANDALLRFDPLVDGVPGTRQDFEFSGQTQLRVDVGAGYWLCRNRCARKLTGVALLAELHYSTTLEDADLYEIPTPGIPGGTILLGNSANRIDILNATAGTVFELSRRSTLSVAGVAPLRDGEDKPFDFEIQVQANIFRR